MPLVRQMAPAKSSHLATKTDHMVISRHFRESRRQLDRADGHWKKQTIARADDNIKNRTATRVSQRVNRIPSDAFGRRLLYQRCCNLVPPAERCILPRARRSSIPPRCRLLLRRTTRAHIKQRARDVTSGGRRRRRKGLWDARRQRRGLPIIARLQSLTNLDAAIME